MLVASLLWGCGVAANTPPLTAASPAPAQKVTCAEPVVTRLPSGMRTVERRLEPYGPQLLGVQVMHADANDARTLLVVTGGYLDEVIEAYDDLEPRGRLSIRRHQAAWLSGSFLDRPVNVAVWLEKETEPCDVRAVIAEGLSAQAFRRSVQSIR